MLKRLKDVAPSLVVPLADLVEIALLPVLYK
jgi:hypothetical protein